MNYQYELQWNTKRDEFFDRLHAFAEEMYLEQPYILEDSVSMLLEFVSAMNKQSEIEDEVDEFKRQIEEM